MIISARLIFLTFLWCISVGFPVLATDKFLWLENDKEPKVERWVNKQNQTTLDRFASSASFKESRIRIESQLKNKSRVDFIHYLGDQFVRTHIEDKNSRGQLQTLTREQTETSQKNWKTLIDFDQLSQQLNRPVQLGEQSKCNPFNPKQCLISLSFDGADKREFREFDLTSRQFVTNGIKIPAGKTYVAWVDEDTIIFSSSFDGNPISDSGFGLSVKRLQRGQSVKDAETIYQVDSGDGLIPVQYFWNDKAYILLQHWHDFYSGDLYLYENKDITKLNIPTSHEVYGVNSDAIIVKTYKDWNIKGVVYPKGSLVGVNVAQQTVRLEKVFEPSTKQAFQDVYFTKQHMLLMVLEDMETKAIAVTRNKSGNFESKYIVPPSKDVLRILSSSYWNDEAVVVYRGFLNPTALYLMNTSSEKLVLWEKSPDSFDTSKYEYSIHFAKGADGVEIPYQMVAPKHLDPEKRYPTIIYVYGAYGDPRTAWYRADIGTDWLDKGGIFVVANARGGGAYGPAWHEAARKMTKHKTAEDVASVASALIKRQVASNKTIGVYGTSAGGATACQVLMMYPETVNAAICVAAIIDLIRMQQLDGSQWFEEFGNPDVNDEKAYLLQYSPYEMVDKKNKYPSPLLLTYKNDDRVNTAHARKFVAKMQKFKHDAYLYQSSEGSHSGATTIEERAKIKALEYEYFMQMLSVH